MYIYNIYICVYVWIYADICGYMRNVTVAILKRFKLRCCRQLHGLFWPTSQYISSYLNTFMFILSRYVKIGWLRDEVKTR